jgi:hypothetical protein
VLLSAFSLGGLISSPVADRVVDRVCPSDGLRLVAVASNVVDSGSDRARRRGTVRLWAAGDESLDLASGADSSPGVGLRHQPVSRPLAGVLPFSLFP